MEKESSAAPSPMPAPSPASVRLDVGRGHVADHLANYRARKARYDKADDVTKHYFKGMLRIAERELAEAVDRAVAEQERRRGARKVGDRVRYVGEIDLGAEGFIEAIDEFSIWVRWDDGNIGEFDDVSEVRLEFIPTQKEE